MIKLPKSAVLKVHILASLRPFNPGELTVSTVDLSKHYADEYCLVKVVELEVDFDENFDPTAQIIESLNAKRDKLKADYYVADKAISDQIEELKAIENKGGENA